MAESESLRKRKRGIEKRRAVMGPEKSPWGHGSRDMAPFFQDWIYESVWGDLWCRPALGEKTRLLIGIIALVMSHQERQLKGFLRAAAKVGWTRDEIIEALVHLTPYAGAPIVHNALDLYHEVLAEEEAAATSA